MKKIIFSLFSLGLLQLILVATSTYAATSLQSGDIFIITANSDAGYPGGTNSNAFEFVAKVDLDAGTQIYFADRGWDGSVSAWRTGGEGMLRYTVPAGGISAGTIVYYDDTLIPTLPTSGSAIWDMYTVSSTGLTILATNSSNGFDPANAGDNILVFQGTISSPNFLYGIGFTGPSTWISTGTPTSNNSYIPSPISSGSNTVVTLGNTDNYQYNCAVTGLYASGLLAAIANPANWNANDTTMYGGSTCVFTKARPELLSIKRQNPTSEYTQSGSVIFRATFTGGTSNVNTSSFVFSSGSLTGTIASVQSISTDVYDITITGIVGNGVINLDIASGNSIVNSAGNPLILLTPSLSDGSYVVDTTPPSITLVGSGNMTILKGLSYTESGASWSDIIDGSGVVMTPFSGSVDTSTVGTYTLYYKKTDTAGNESNIVSRIVNIISGNPPILTINPAYVTIARNTSYTDTGVTASDVEDGNLTSSIVSSGTLNLASTGTYILDYTVTDSQGNTATGARTITVIPIEYTVIFRDFDGTALKTQTGVIEGTDAIPPTSPTRTGYTFTGWTGGTLMNIQADTDFTAEYNINSYTLTFNSDGGTAVTSITQDYNSTVTAPISPTKTGYIFAGWSPVLPGSMPASNTTHTGTWTANNYTVAFDANGGSGTMTSQSFTFDTPQSLTTNTLTRAGYNFVNWNTQADGLGTNYNNVESVSNLSSTNGDIVTLYAQWTDIEAPVITANGNPNITLEVGTPYTDAGATATDNHDGNITANIVTAGTGSVNTNQVGTYTITYNVSDSQGNVAIQVTRTITVVDTTPPIITFSGVTSINHLKNTPYTDSGATCTDNYDTTCTVTSSGTVDITTLGSYTITYSVTDANGNIAPPVTRIVNVVAGNSPVITITGSNPIIVAHGSVYTDGGATASDTEDGNISSLITSSGVVNASIIGTYIVQYAVTDSQGNAVTASRTVNVVDQTSPVITLSGSATINLMQGVPYIDAGATCTDNVDIPCTVTSTGSVDTSLPGTYVITYRSTDMVGNATTMMRTIIVSAIQNTTGSGGGGGGVAGPITPITNNQNPITPPTPPTPSKVSLLPTQSLATPAGTNKNNQNIYTIENRITDYICPKIVQVYTEDELKSTDLNMAPNFADDMKAVLMFRGLEKDEQMNGQTFEEYKKFGIAINDTSFEPTRNVTRAEYVKMLVRALSCRYQKEGTNTPFSDVDENMWYAEYINFATNHGWINGYQDGTFRPDAPITRAEAAKILANAIQLQTQNPGTIESLFSDVPDSSVFTPYIEALRDNKVISGRTATTYAPNDYIPRTEVSRIIYKTFLGGQPK